MIEVAIIDDHLSVIVGIGAWLKSTGRFEIAGTARSIAEARQLMERLHPLPAVIILDISLGGGTAVSPSEDGLEFIAILKEICEERNVALPEILVCSMFEDPFIIKRAMDMGAHGFVPKSALLGEILAAVDALLAGKIYINEKYKTQNENLQNLTHRENEIVSLIKQSFTMKKIAMSLNISPRTVENHLAHIYTKTGAKTREDLYEL